MTEAEKLEVLRRARNVGHGRNKLENTVTLPEGLFNELVKAVSASLVEEAWYLSRYADVDAAIKKGELATCADHFAVSGLYEGRIPYPIEIDETDYLTRHHDVAKAVNAGVFVSASDHFLQSGFAEGRPFKLAEDNRR